MLQYNLIHRENPDFCVDFPEPQYLGAKHKLASWIVGHMPETVSAVFDGFGGSQSIAFMVKTKGKEVHTNDLMRYAHHTGMALIENRDATLSEADVHMLFAENPSRGSLMQSLFSNIFFNAEDAVFLDNFRANVELLQCEYKKSLALCIMNRSLTRKIIMGHFAHLQAIPYANDPVRVRRNPSIAKPVSALFLELLPEYNRAVFDNRQKNRSYAGNVLEILPRLKNIDLAYYDPPYCNSHSDYQAFYHLLETFVEYWPDKEFSGGTRRYHPSRASGFDKKKGMMESLHSLFAFSSDIPLVFMSYNCRSYPDINGLMEIARRYRRVEVHEKEYRQSRGGKGSVSGSREYLLVCRK
ncbi:MAG: DNA adenine methylase [Pseudomonadota bacterium]|nr:DNA adenine methylase [Pseudomonadota bacterium]MDE3037693.1 DNA adenine methylase [Pseudomonadota bacterium]